MREMVAANETGMSCTGTQTVNGYYTKKREIKARDVPHSRTHLAVSLSVYVIGRRFPPHLAYGEKVITAVSLSGMAILLALLSKVQ